MYGYDGNCCALTWAELCGLQAVNPTDRQKLIDEGYFTEEGVRTTKTRKVTTLN
jgi:hypothetical protein